MPIDYYTRMAQQQQRDANRTNRLAAAKYQGAQKQAEIEAQRQRDEEFRQQQMLQEQQFKQQQQQAILQANLQNMSAAGRMYAEQQNGRQDQRARLAMDQQLRQRNRLDGINTNNQNMANAWEQSRIQRGMNDQAAGIQSERDAIQHGYGQDDARLAQVFNQDNAALAQGYTLDRGRQAQQFAQQNAAQAQQYGLQTGAVQHGYGLERDQVQHGYGQDNARMQYGLQQQGADADLGRDQQRLGFQNDLQQDNDYDQLIKEKVNAGWSYSPAIEQKMQKYKMALAELPDKVAGIEMTWEDAQKQARLIRGAMRYMVPDVPPKRQNAQDMFDQSSVVDPNTGVRYGVAADKPPTLLHDPEALRSRMKPQQTSPDEALNEFMPAPQREFEKMVMDNWKSQEDRTNEETGISRGKEFTQKEIREQMLDRFPAMRKFYPNGQPGGAQQTQMPPLWDESGPPPGWQGGQPQQPGVPQQPPRAQQAMDDPIQVAAMAKQELSNLDQEPYVKAAMELYPQQAEPLVQRLKSEMQRYISVLQSGRDPDQIDPEWLTRLMTMKQQLGELTKGANPSLPPAESMAQPPGAWIPGMPNGRPNYEF